jgi:hypothetical protein
VLLAEPILISLPVLWFFASPILGTSEAPAHLRHGKMFYFHVIGGLCVIIAGGGALHIGWTGADSKRHRWFGYTYLGLGSVMSLSALSFLPRPLTNLAASI